MKKILPSSPYLNPGTKQAGRSNFIFTKTVVTVSATEILTEQVIAGLMPLYHWLDVNEFLVTKN